MVVINTLLEVSVQTALNFRQLIPRDITKQYLQASSSFEATVNIQNILKRRDDRNLAHSISIERNVTPSVTRMYSYSFETT